MWILKSVRNFICPICLGFAFMLVGIRTDSGFNKSWSRVNFEEFDNAIRLEQTIECRLDNSKKSALYWYSRTDVIKECLIAPYSIENISGTNKLVKIFWDWIGMIQKAIEVAYSELRMLLIIVHRSEIVLRRAVAGIWYHEVTEERQWT
jgi:hypothetical protein